MACEVLLICKQENMNYTNKKVNKSCYKNLGVNEINVSNREEK